MVVTRLRFRRAAFCNSGTVPVRSSLAGFRFRPSAFAAMELAPAAAAEVLLQRSACAAVHARQLDASKVHNDDASALRSSACNRSSRKSAS